MWGPFHKRYLSHQSPKLARKLLTQFAKTMQSDNTTLYTAQHRWIWTILLWAQYIPAGKCIKYWLAALYSAHGIVLSRMKLENDHTKTSRAQSPCAINIAQSYQIKSIFLDLKGIQMLAKAFEGCVANRYTTYITDHGYPQKRAIFVLRYEHNLV